jgi:hypothetical protein
MHKEKKERKMIVTLYYTLPQVAVLCGITQQEVKVLSERFGIQGRMCGAVMVFTSEQASHIRIASDLTTRSKEDLVALIISNRFSKSLNIIA